MKQSHVYLKGTMDSYLHVISFVPEEPPKGIVHILHGMGEHAQRYQDFASYLTDKGFAVFAHDHRGHGKSLQGSQKVGLFNKTDSFEAIIDDVEIVRKYIQDTYRDLPMHLLGHSMGSVILRRYLQLYPHSSGKVVVMGTLPKYGNAYTKIMRLMVAILGLFKSNKKRHEGIAKILNDGLIKQIDQPRTAYDWLSKDERIVDAYVADPLCGYAYNKRFYKSFFKTVERVNKLKNIQKHPQVPTMLISGEEDPLNNHMAAVHLLAETYREAVNNLSIKVVAVENARHEVLNELQKEKTYAILMDFFN